MSCLLNEDILAFAFCGLPQQQRWQAEPRSYLKLGWSSPQSVSGLREGGEVTCWFCWFGRVRIIFLSSVCGIWVKILLDELYFLVMFKAVRRPKHLP